MNRERLLRSVPSVGVLIAGGMLLASATTAAAAQAGGGLAGAWASIDTDGSHQTLDIAGTGNRVYSMVYVDEAATAACAGGPARLSGPGYVDGDSVTMVAALICLPGGNPVRQRLVISFQHNGEDDTLTDDFGIVWRRVN